MDKLIQEKLNQRDPKYTFYFNKSTEILENFKGRSFAEIEEFMELFKSMSRNCSTYSGIKGFEHTEESEHYGKLLE